MSVLEDAVAELKKVGYTDEKIAKLLELILPEVQEEMLLDLAGICTEEELAEYENRLEQARTKQDIEQLNEEMAKHAYGDQFKDCLLYTSPSPRDRTRSRMPSSA